jgi:OmcA/MtrC family decaheme c-type cytochrome
MKVGFKAPRVVGVFVLLLSVAAVGVAALVDDSQKVYSILDKAFYLSAEEGVWIRPGLNLEIKSVYIPANLQPVVIFRITDGKGQPLDREGKVTPGPVTTSFIMAYIPQNAPQYVAYTTRVQGPSPITGQSALQATGENTGTYTSQGDGTYMYQFKTALPANYDQAATHTLGIYSTRNMSEFGQPNYYANELKSWVPNGSQVTKIRDVAGTTACNQCHDPLMLHGGSRQKMELCILCHTPQTTDPDTGNTVDMKVMVHKIHMGSNLPSGKPYIIIGNRQSVNDYSEVTYPQDIRHCTQCHKDAQQVNNWMLNPTRATCGSCHDTVNFASGEDHAGGAQKDDSKCSQCHWPESDTEYDASISGAHTVPYRSTQLRNPEYHLLSITDTAPGQKPTVKFQITDKTSAFMKPSDFTAPAGRLALTIGGPNTDYRQYFQEAADKAAYDEASHTATYTFTNAIPADATGSYTLSVEGRLNTTLNPGTTKEFVWEESPTNVVLPFGVTDTTPTIRRTVVDQSKCQKCHDVLELHGGNRNQVSTCVICHDPAKTDAARRPASAAPTETVDMKILIHKIHTGLELSSDYTVYGFGGSVNNFNDITYPGDRRDCVKCHIAGTYTVPLPSVVTPTTTPRNYWNPTMPTSAACLGCHDSVEAAAHAYVNTAPFGEACAACHSTDAEFGVDQVHAR